MMAVLVEWMSGGQFLTVFFAGMICGAGLVWAVAGIRTLDADQAHRRLLHALERIYIGLGAGWSVQDAVDEAGRALDLDRRPVVRR